MIRWILNQQNADGGWGLHTAGTSTINATVLYYVTLGILGVHEFHADVARARQKLMDLDGALLSPQWARYWLALLNLYRWDGVQPVPSEIWALPEWVPFHPGDVYLPVSFLYSSKHQMEPNPLIIAIRKEIYSEPYENIQVGAQERRKPMSPFLKVANSAIFLWEIYSAANETVLDLIRREDENTSYNDIAPVNKAFHMVAVYFSAGPHSEELRLHHEKVTPFFWMGSNGLNCGGTNGAQLRDTAFSVISIAEADDLVDPYRQKIKGGWPFSTKGQSHIVSDCATEGLKATLMLQEELKYDKLISDRRLQDCVDTLLHMQNPDGGFGSYERARTGTFVELLNPAELSDRCIIEYSYPECSAAVVTALSLFNKHFPEYAAENIKTTITATTRYLEREKRPDGKGLVAVGRTYSTYAAVRQGCEFLLAKQREDGGRGEHWTSCEQKKYLEHPQNQVVNTAWAVLGLMAAHYPYGTAISRGLELIRPRQQKSGEWLQEANTLNRSTIEYPNYKFIFPIRALGRFEHEYLPKIKAGTSIQ
ncbi:terpenoid cyclases/protein prenyltransferase alpha-alpha toroid [Phaeosphaeriaceae sp. PMI808]|nr:terpenoid cyclases/protein prenyltransferase alpha-alpha toroid [Phaeosphaeriaceae sp. PMI808]